MRRAAGEIPDQPCVDVAEGELAALGPLARALDVVEDPGHLRAPEVRIEQQPGPLADVRLEALRLELLAERRGPPVLPDDRVVDRLSGLAIPDQRRLALVGDPDRREVTGGDPGVAQRALRRLELRAPDVLRVVLDPARLRKVLRKLALIEPADRAVLVEDDRARTGRALVGSSSVISPCQSKAQDIWITQAAEMNRLYCHLDDSDDSDSEVSETVATNANWLTLSKTSGPLGRGAELAPLRQRAARLLI